MLTPIDIQNRELKSKMGGYDKKDVDDFLLEIVASYEEVFKENQGLKEKITSLSEGIQYYKKMESTLQKALVLAEKTSSETQEAAKSQADSVMTQASVKAEALSRETKAEIEALRREAQAQAEITRAKANRELEETRNHVRKLVQSYENYRLQFKKLAEAQIEMLDSESFSIFVPELDELMNDAPSADSVMDDPGIIPINIGSPAPFVALPDEPAEPPKVEEVPVDNVSFSVPVSSENSFESMPQEGIGNVTNSIADIPSIDIPVASAADSSVASIPVAISPTGSPAVEEIPVSITPTAPVGMETMGEIPVAITPTEPAAEQSSAVSIDVGAMAQANTIGLDFATSQAQADPMMDVPGMTSAPEPTFTTESSQKDMFVATDSPFMDAAAGNNMMIGDTDTMAPANDLLGGAAPTSTNDLFVGAEPAPAPSSPNDMFVGTQMNGFIGGETPVNDLFAEPAPAPTPSNDILSGDAMNDMLGGFAPAPQPTTDNGMMDMSSFMDAPAPAVPAPEPAAAPQVSNNGIITDPMMDMGGVMDIPSPTPAPAPASQPQDNNIMDMNPFNFIDP